MIFADKLIRLRKKNGWSQEELAEQMGVTRQSISKWEGAQAVPDLEKMLHLARLFGVSTDYLLKDELEAVDGMAPDEEESGLRRVSIGEANTFLEVRAAASRTIALGTFLCILSPICLFLLAALSEMGRYGLNGNLACGIGLIVLLGFVAVAVALFVRTGSRSTPFAYLEKESFETEYGVSGMVKERQEKYRSTYAKSNLAGTCLCVLSVLPLFCGLTIGDVNELLLTAMLSLTLVIAGLGTVLFIRSGVIWASFEKLLQEGDYSRAKKEKQPVLSAIATAYWLTATAIFLGYSLATENWEYSWIIWVVAGVLYPAVIGLCNALWKKN